MNKERLYERLKNYRKASSRLNEAIKLDSENDIIVDGVIQRFEFTFELSWKLIKIFLEFNGINEIRSPRDAIQEAFSYGLIEDGANWIDMLIDRNKISHIYDEEEARLIYEKITQKYNDLLIKFADMMNDKINEII